MNKQKGFVWLVLAIVVVLVVIFFWNKQAVAPTGEGENASSTSSVTAPKPAVTTQSTTVSKPVTPITALPQMTNAGAYIVYYTSSGFVPANLTVPVKSTVHFANSSNSSMSIMTLDDRNLPYSSLNQGKSVGKGGSFDFAFVVSGSYTYKNLNAPQHTGTITVR